MRKLLLFSAAVLLLSFAGCGGEEETVEAGLGDEGGPAESVGDDEELPEVYTGRYVYVTEHGDRYHTPFCRHVRGKENLRKLTRDEAALEDYEPCKVCNPGPPR
ncbi:hypothetical protein KAU45_05855 [bacterium]|nr:hypothetical protein [bacterium]